LQNKREVYSLLLRASAETLLTVAREAGLSKFGDSERGSFIKRGSGHGNGMRHIGAIGEGNAASAGHVPMVAKIKRRSMPDGNRRTQTDKGPAG
jgi:hypothetical protein